MSRGRAVVGLTVPGLAALLLAAAAAIAAPRATGQEPALPPVFERLLGQWRGEGTLMGRPAEFEMTWSRALNGRFVLLQFANAFAAPEPGASTTPVIAATAYYLPDAGDPTAAAGTWFDTRGVILPLLSVVSATELVTQWGDDESAESGRTTYRIVSADRIEVIDEVMRDGSYATFARATYGRRR